MTLGHSVTAIEGDIRAVEMARAKGIDVRHGDIENRAIWEELTGPYDVVLFMHVLEHLVDPWSVLRMARDRLSENGRVISLVPNIATWRIRKDLFFHGSFQYEDTGILDRTHLRFFTLTTAIDLHRTAGFDLVQWVPTEVCVPIERRLRVQLRQKRVAQLWKKILMERFPNLCSEILLFEARVGSR
jgi:SAM-dependent methyltransferase